MAPPKTTPVVGAEVEHVIKILNDAILAWNERERTVRGCGPVGGVDFIANGPPYRVTFLHCESGRKYGIVAPRYEPFAEGHSFRRIRIEPWQVQRVVRFPTWE